MIYLLIFYLYFSVPITFVVTLIVLGIALLGRSKSRPTRYFAYSCLALSILNAFGMLHLDSIPAGDPLPVPISRWIIYWAILWGPPFLALVAAVCSSTSFPRPRQPSA